MHTQLKSRFRIILFGVVALGMFVYLLGAGSLPSVHAQGAEGPTPSVDKVIPGTFGKKSPADNGTLPANSKVTFEWEASANVNNYYFCFDQNNDDRCEGPWYWSDNTDFTINLSGQELAPGTTYYWQVMSCSSGDPKPSGCIEANSGVWWSFKIARVYKIYLPLIRAH
jgi:hypothetical protein